jgi:hypothetical protein
VVGSLKFKPTPGRSWRPYLKSKLKAKRAPALLSVTELVKGPGLNPSIANKKTPPKGSYRIIIMKKRKRGRGVKSRW